MFSIKTCTKKILRRAKCYFPSLLRAPRGFVKRQEIQMLIHLLIFLYVKVKFPTKNVKYVVCSSMLDVV